MPQGIVQEPMFIQLKRILKEVFKHKLLMVMVALSGIIMSLAQWQLALSMKGLFEALESKNPELIKSIPGWILLVTLVMVSARYIHQSSMNIVADLITLEFRRKLQNRFMELSQAFHAQFEAGSGGLISRILNDISVVQHGLRLVADFFAQPLAFVLLIGTLFWKDWQLTLGILIILPPLVLFLKQMGKSLRKYGHKGQEVLEKLTQHIKESLDGVKVIQSFGLQAEMARRFDQEAERFLRARKSFHRRAELTGPVTELVATSVSMVIFVYIGMRMTNSQASLGDFGSYLAALLMLQQPIKKIQESFIKIQESLVSIQRVFEIIEDKREIKTSLNPKIFPSAWQKIEFKNVSFQYSPDTFALKNINLIIQRGQSIAFVGASGSGKSTLASLLQRFMDPTQGEILIDDINIKDFDLATLRKKMGLVTQDVFLFADTVKRNIHAGDFTKDAALIIPAAMAAGAHEFIMKTADAYESFVGDRGALFSGGEKQRLSIARAFFKDPDILILDEATSALDSASEQAVQKGLESLMHGRTCFIIAHRLSTVRDADLIVVLSGGCLVEMGTHDELIQKKGEYAQALKMQTQGLYH